MKELIEIVIKVFAAYLIFSTLGDYAPLAFVPGAISGPNAPPMWYFISSIGVPLVIGFVLWFKAPGISHSSFSSEVSGPIILEDGLVTAGVFLIGVYWFIKSISVLLTQLGTQTPINPGWCAVSVLSVGLILGSRFFLKIYRKIRTAGNDR